MARKTFEQVGDISDLVPGDRVDQSIIRNMATTGRIGGIKRTENYIQSNYVGGMIGGIKLYYTFVRLAPSQPFYYCGLCRAGESVNLLPEEGRRVFVISAFHADTFYKASFHEKFNRAIAKYEWIRGHIPVMPHLYFPQFTGDEGFSRTWGIEAGHAMMNSCHTVTCYTVDKYISDGMKEDLEYAASLGHEVKYEEYTRDEAYELIQEMAGTTL